MTGRKVTRRNSMRRKSMRSPSVTRSRTSQTSRSEINSSKVSSFKNSAENLNAAASKESVTAPAPVSLADNTSERKLSRTPSSHLEATLPLSNSILNVDAAEFVPESVKKSQSHFNVQPEEVSSEDLQQKESKKSTDDLQTVRSSADIAKIDDQSDFKEKGELGRSASSRMFDFFTEIISKESTEEEESAAKLEETEKPADNFAEASGLKSRENVQNVPVDGAENAPAGSNNGKVIPQKAARCRCVVS